MTRQGGHISRYLPAALLGLGVVLGLFARRARRAGIQTPPRRVRTGNWSDAANFEVARPAPVRQIGSRQTCESIVRGERAYESLPEARVSLNDRPVRLAGYLLAISYGIGAPIAAILELRSGLISVRFDLPPELVLLACAIQVVAAGGVLTRRFAPWAAAALTITTLGAVGAHLRIGSPLTSVPAVIYSIVQLWFGFRRGARRRARV